MRLFIGLTLPEEIQVTLQNAWKTVAPQIHAQRPLKPSSWHVTLAFLDDVTEEHLEKVRELVEMATKHPATGIWKIDAIGSFPSRNPTRIVAHITPEFPRTWTMFAEGVRDLASLIAPKVDRRPWKPYVAIVRERRGIEGEPFLHQIEPIIWKPAELALLKNTADPLTYEKLHVFSIDV